jgi:hypothetical protein
MSEPDDVYEQLRGLQLTIRSRLSFFWAILWLFFVGGIGLTIYGSTVPSPLGIIAGAAVTIVSILAFTLAKWAAEEARFETFENVRHELPQEYQETIASIIKRLLPGLGTAGVGDTSPSSSPSQRSPARTAVTLVRESFVHPLSTSYIDSKTGKVLERK